jgi:N-succinyldiaminopimelate aminotransferase
LPGSYLARDTPQAPHHNPGEGRIRMALVASTDECLQAAERIVEFMKTRRATSTSAVTR